MKNIKNWIKCGNDCEKCQYCWEEKISNKYDEWDYGCYIKGLDYADKACYLINPFRHILGRLKLRKGRKYDMCATVENTLYGKYGKRAERIGVILAFVTYLVIYQ